MSLIMTEQEALEYPGHIFRHYKGGIYQHIVRTEAAANHSASSYLVWYGSDDPLTLKITDDVVAGEPVVIYKHLWPHDHQFFMRPERSWNEPLEDGSKRFAEIKNDR